MQPSRCHHRSGIQVISVFVGHENQVGIGEGAVVGFPAYGINVDDFPPEGEHEGAVANEGDGEVTGICGEDVLLELAL